MPQEGPGRRYDATATKATSHNSPVVELNHPGVAAKSEQIAPAAPSVANAAAAVQIGVGEDFVIMLDGEHTFASTFLPGGAVVGSQLYIKAADNTLHLAADALSGGVLQAGFLKYGVVDFIDTTNSLVSVNLNLKGSF